MAKLKRANTNLEDLVYPYEGTLDFDPVTITISPEYIEIQPVATAVSTPISAVSTPVSAPRGASQWIRQSDVIAVRVDDKAYIPTQRLYCVDHGDDEDGDSTDMQFRAYDMTGLPSDYVEEVAVREIPEFLCSRPPAPAAAMNGHGGPPPKKAVMGRGRELYFVVSTHAGTQKAKRVFQSLVRPLLEDIGIDRYEVLETDGEESVARFTQNTILPRANQGVEQTVVLLSGDGGVVDLVNVLCKEGLKDGFVKPVVGLLPVGTANALAHSTRVAGDGTFGLRSLLGGVVKDLPTFRVKVSQGARWVVDGGRGRKEVQGGEAFGAVVFSWGLHASTVAMGDTAEYRRHGINRFNMAADELMHPNDGSEHHRYKGRVSLIKEGDKLETIERKEHSYVLASMVSNLDEHFCISPSSQPLDGQMQYVGIGAVSSAEVMRLLGKACQGGLHVDEKSVTYEAIEGLWIGVDEEEGEWRQVCVDGQIVALEKGGWAEATRDHRPVAQMIVRKMVEKQLIFESVLPEDQE